MELELKKYIIIGLWWGLTYFAVVASIFVVIALTYIPVAILVTFIEPVVGESLSLLIQILYIPIILISPIYVTGRVVEYLKWKREEKVECSVRDSRE